MKRKLFIAFITTLIFLFSISCEYIPLTKGVSENKTESYFYYKGNSLTSADLKTVSQWSGKESREITYEAKKAPWILNSKYTVTSSISHDYEIQILKPTQLEGFSSMEDIAKHGTEYSSLVNDTGKYIIKIKASGVDWMVKIGVENK